MVQHADDGHRGVPDRRAQARRGQHTCVRPPDVSAARTPRCAGLERVLGQSDAVYPFGLTRQAGWRQDGRRWVDAEENSCIRSSTRVAVNGRSDVVGGDRIEVAQNRARDRADIREGARRRRISAVEDAVKAGAGGATELKS
jgi:hypothetical protein